MAPYDTCKYTGYGYKVGAQPLRLFVYRFGAFGVNSVLSFYYFLTRSVYNQRAPNTPVLVPDHINEHTYWSSLGKRDNKNANARTSHCMQKGGLGAG